MINVRFHTRGNSRNTTTVAIKTTNSDRFEAIIDTGTVVGWNYFSVDYRPEQTFVVGASAVDFFPSADTGTRQTFGRFSRRPVRFKYADSGINRPRFNEPADARVCMLGGRGITRACRIAGEKAVQSGLRGAKRKTDPPGAAAAAVGSVR